MPRIRTELRLLRAYSALSAAGFLVLALAAFARHRADESFDVITVHRINVVEPDGRLRLVLSDKARFPGAIVAGKEYAHPRAVAGLLFFDDEQTENGGLTYTGQRTADGYTAYGTLTFDRYRQDQVVGMQYQDENGRRQAGFAVWDRPDRPISDFLELRDAALRLPEGPRRDSAMKVLESFPPGAGRLFVGRERSGAAVVRLADAAGKPRLRLVVDSGGAARVEFLDAAGRVTYALPDSSRR